MDKAGFIYRKEFLDNNDCTNDLFLAAYPILSLDQNDCVHGFEVVPVQPQDVGCAVHGIISALDVHLRRDAGPLVCPRRSVTTWSVVGSREAPNGNAAVYDENVEDGGRAGEAPGNERAVVAGCAESPRGVQLSDWDVERQRASNENTLTYVADILSCRSTRAMTVVLVDVGLPLEVEAGKTCQFMESPDGDFPWYLRMATACGLHVVHECVGPAYSEFLAQHMGLCDKALECTLLSEATMQTMAHALGDFLRLIISKELLFQRTYFDCIPDKFVALVSNDDEQRLQALEFCRRSFEALGELEELVYTDRHAGELHNTWPLEVLLAHCECDFDGVSGSGDACMYKELTECFRGWGVVMGHRTLVH